MKPVVLTSPLSRTLLALACGWELARPDALAAEPTPPPAPPAIPAPIDLGAPTPEPAATPAPAAAAPTASPTPAVVVPTRKTVPRSQTPTFGGGYNPDPGGGRNPGSLPSDLPSPEAATTPSTSLPESLGGAPALPNLFQPNDAAPLKLAPYAKPPPYRGPDELRRGRGRSPRDLPANAPAVPILRLEYPRYQFAAGNTGVLPNAIPQFNRWQIPFGTVDRYNPGLYDAAVGDDNRAAETTYRNGLKLFDPYKVSLLKGDSPIYGQDIFLFLQITDQYLTEFRRIPVGSGVSASRPSSTDFFGRGDSFTISNDLSFTIELFKGETAFKPIDWAIHFTPVFNANHTEFRETPILDPDPRGPNYTGTRNPPASAVPGVGANPIANPSDINGYFNTGNSGLRPARDNDLSGTRYTRRSATFFSLQEAFVEVHLKDLTDNYDFLSFRAGSQLFNADFRGFLFLDTDPALRFFGNFDNNRFQYNASWFSIREKDTYSGLNRITGRDQDVLIANVYRQDSLELLLGKDHPYAQGFTTQFTLAANLDHGSTHYDRSGFLVRPAPIGFPIQEHDVNVFYFGWNGDGHIGKYNITHSFYQALGRDQGNGIAGKPVAINAQMAALELSYDRDYLRPKFSLFYASGDDNARDGKGHGFDSILDNPTFAGAPFSYFTRQGIPLANTALSLKTPNSLVMDLRTARNEGQAQFVNPGTLLVGLGFDLDVTPRIKAQFQANYIRFVNTAPLQQALFTSRVANTLGYDLSLGVTYRPTLTQNIVINAGFGALLTDQGYRDIYKAMPNPVPSLSNRSANGVESVLYSGIIAVTLTY